MKPIRVTHDPPSIDLAFRDYIDSAFKHAESLLEKYCEASLVVTTKIHCALPCLAMGVTVILIHPNPHEERLAPAREFLPVMSLSKLNSLRTMRVPAIAIRNKALVRRKKQVKNFLTQALHYHGNPVALSPDYRALRCRAYFFTYLWYFAFKFCILIGLKKDRLRKIMSNKYS